MVRNNRRRIWPLLPVALLVVVISAALVFQFGGGMGCGHPRHQMPNAAHLDE